MLAPKKECSKLLFFNTLLQFLFKFFTRNSLTAYITLKIIEKFGAILRSYPQSSLK
ncbi:hypothetical protein IGK06_003158 [Enterococcus sp. AZ142]